MADLAQRQRWRYARDIIEGTSTLANGVDRDGDSFTRSKAKKNLIDRLTDIEVRVQQDKKIPEKELHENFIWAGTHLYASHEDEFFLVRKLVSIPFRIFTSKAVEFGVSIWVWISRARPSIHSRLFAELAKNWEWSLRRRKGLFSKSLKYFLYYLINVALSMHSQRPWSISLRIFNDEPKSKGMCKKPSHLTYSSCGTFDSTCSPAALLILKRCSQYIVWL